LCVFAPASQQYSGVLDIVLMSLDTVTQLLGTCSQKQSSHGMHLVMDDIQDPNGPDIDLEHA
jgi:hypothetical protein